VLARRVPSPVQIGLSLINLVTGRICGKGAPTSADDAWWSRTARPMTETDSKQKLWWLSSTDVRLASHRRGRIVVDQNHVGVRAGNEFAHGTAEAGACDRAFSLNSIAAARPTPRAADLSDVLCSRLATFSDSNMSQV
jgi:hypothetical protein